VRIIHGRMKIALFPGSFDPFTLGHLEIVNRALSVFDQVVIGIGINSHKKTLFSPDERVKMIEACFAGNSTVKVTTYEGLTTDLAKQTGACGLLRGIRSSSDLDFEGPVAAVNREVLSGIETVFLISSGATAHISSTLVRELIRYKAPLTGMVPDAIMPYVSGKSV
jgi:pantetheine-phosphate adenylyltransferase